MSKLSAASAGALALLYALAGCSNPPAGVADLAKGSMAKLTMSAAPTPAPATPFHDASGHAHTLAELQGKVAIINLWANWCAPCKEEIPSLARLATAYAGKPVAVTAISVGKGDDETKGAAFIAANPPLTFYTEPTYALAFAFKPVVEGMPTTVLYDRHGHERARLTGGADWSSPQAKAVIDALLAEK